MSLIELLLATIVFALVLLIGYATYRSFIATTAATTGQNALRQLAGSMQQYEQSRGFFPSTIGELEDLEPDLDYTLAASTGENRVSIHVDPTTGHAGLALRTRSRECLTMVVQPTGATSPSATARFTPELTRPCSGTQALLETGTAW